MPTRSSKSKTATDADTVAKETLAPTLSPSDETPPQLFILPRDASAKARFYILPNPTTSKPSRYFYCPDHGLYEFLKVGSPPSLPGSFLIAKDTARDTVEGDVVDTKEERTSDVAAIGRPITEGYILEDADIFVATPFDPLFFLIPTFEDLNFFKKSTFRQEDDFFERLAPDSTHMQLVLQRKEFRTIILERLRAVSDIQELGEETLYRPSRKLLFKEIVDKATRAVDPANWPGSLEKHEIRKATDIPSLPSLREDESTSGIEPLPEVNESERNPNTPVIQEDAEKSSSQAPSDSISEHVKHLFRLHNAITLITQSYLPRTETWLEYISQQIISNDEIDFKPMEQHRTLVKKRKDELQALRSLSDNISRKRSALEDDEAAEARAEKKRKKEEEEKKNKSESRALKNLKKADTSGMKKLSSFFTKASPKIKG